MTATLKLPRVLTEVVGTEVTHHVAGADVAAALEDLFRREPGLRNHVVDEQGLIRPHVSVFVDGIQARLETPVADNAEIRLLQAVSGGADQHASRDGARGRSACFCATGHRDDARRPSRLEWSGADRHRAKTPALTVDE